MKSLDFERISIVTCQYYTRIVRMPKKNTDTYPKTISSRYGKVIIYENANRGKWKVYVVTWSVGRVRNRKSFSDEMLAQNHAETVLEQIANGQPLAGQITASDALYFESCKKKLGGVPLMAAVDYYLMMHGSTDGVGGMELAKVRDAYLKDLEARGNSDRDLKGVKSHLKALCDAISGPITRVKATDIDSFLQSKNCANRTRANMRISICRLWNWAKAKGHIPRNMENAAEASSKYKSEYAASPGIFTPDQLALMLAEAEEAWLPYITICAFAGLRQAEACRLTWEDVRLDESAIILGAHITKTNKRRVAHMPENLVAWLKSVDVEKEGSICPASRPNKETSRAAEAAGVEWVQNGLRHSYISYQMALSRDAAGVAEQCGNSADEIQSSYKANALESEAKRWFSIMPQT